MLQLTNASVGMPDGNIFQQIRGILLPKKYEEDRNCILDDITLWLGRGESWAVLGNDSEGKRAFMRLISGHIPVSKGHCSVEGRVASALREEDSLIDSETGQQNAHLALCMTGIPESECRELTDSVERMACLNEAFRQPVREYDDQMRARLMLSIALAVKPDILIISRVLEICGLPYTQRYIMEIRQQIKEGMTMLIENDDSGMLSRVCESAIWLEGGKLKQLGYFEVVYAAYSFTGAQYAKTPWEQREEDAVAGADTVLEAAETESAQNARQENESENEVAEVIDLPGRIRAENEAVEKAKEKETTKQNIVDAKEWQGIQKVAFSDQFAPDINYIHIKSNNIEDIRYQLEETRHTIRRLNAQITEYARANLAYEEENQKLQQALIAERSRAKQAEADLKSLIDSVTENLRIIHEQFKLLSK